MSAAPASGPPERSNVQGLIMRGYTHPYSTHMLFSFPSRAAAGAFMKSLLPYLQSAVDWGEKKPEMMLNVGFTCSGLQKATALTPGDFEQFPAVFSSGPDSDDSQQSLCDVGTPSDPSLWWAKNFKTADLHCVVHTYALDAEAMGKIVSFVAGAAQSAGVTELFGTADKTRLVQGFLPDDQIQFGYRDGISEPDLKWPVPGKPFDASTLNNFVIGYDGSPFSPGPTGDNAAGRFAKDGCYNAFRILSQDVAGFEAFLDLNAPEVAAKLKKTTADAREWIAAKVIGRWRNGSPLELSPDAPDDKTRDAEDFGYAKDTKGMKCPISAHTRVANPRDQQVDDNDQPVPRIIRRGMPYGPPFGAGDPVADRGLIGLFLVGALDAQFELIYGWMNINNFSDLFSPGFDTQDAVVANHQLEGAEGSFLMPTKKGPIKIALPQFLTTRGTAYCLLPSIASIQAIAAQTV
jgi:deferrochelatase/peroxidase EfeB